MWAEPQPAEAMGVKRRRRQPLRDFCNFLGKKANLMPFRMPITFRRCSEPFERTKFLTFESQLK